jgi:O-acetyl-ADP-ribose deacetylase (regulator of RNase III)
MDLVTVIHEKQLQSIALPALGCGLGGLDWQDVRPLIIKTLEPIQNIVVIVFEPVETS